MHPRSRLSFTRRTIQGGGDSACKRRKSFCESMDAGDVNCHPFRFNEVVKEIRKGIVCRDEEIKDILGLLGQTPQDEPPPAIFIYGDTGTGKSLIVKNCLELGKFRFAVVNCIEAYSMKLIYEGIVNQLTNHVMSPENSFQPYARINNFLDFALELQSVSEKFEIGKQDRESYSIIIVLDKAEKLRNVDKNVLSAFLKLQELTKLKISVVFLSVLPWTNFLNTDHALEPITYYLCHYTQKQVFEILLLDKPSPFSLKFYENYLNLFLSIFYQACHDIRELKYQAKVNFDIYSDPIKKGIHTENNVGELWKKSQHYFKKSLKSLYLKMDNDMESVEKLTSVKKLVLNMELPFYSKYLLIGSYIASYNPSKEDKKLFLKNHGKIKKSKIKHRKAGYHLLGPRPFKLQRLFAIVSTILDDDNFNLSADLFIEVASLVKMNLLTQISEDTIDCPTFKCNVGLQFIDVISKNVEFPIRKYLVDFIDS